MNTARLRRLVLAATFAAIIFLGTFLIKIPIPNGYIHFGDGFLYAAAVLLPLPHALAAAALAGLLADLLSGFAAYAPFTLLVKAAMALTVSLLARRSAYAAPSGRGRRITAATLAGVVNTAGYFAADCILYSLPAAITTLPANLVQAAFGVAVFLIFLPILTSALARFDRH